MSSANPDTTTHIVNDAPAAGPNATARTGRSHMAEYGAQLTASYVIAADENEEDFPYTRHTINAHALFMMFYNMMIQIVVPLSRELGFPDPTAAAATTALHAIAASVAYAALEAAYSVCFNKARRHDPMITRALRIPSITHETFPIYITALINSLGPIQRADYPSRRTHVPLIETADLDAEYPHNYQTRLILLFKEKVQRSKVLLSNVEALGSATSAWWTFRPVATSSSTIADYGRINLNAPQYLSAFKVFSPVRFDEVESFLKLATIYARMPIVEPGLGAWSCTEWYTEDELNRFTTVLPPLNAFPDDAKHYPFFWKSCSAYYAKVEGRSVTDPDPGTSVTTGTPAAAASNQAAQSARIRRRANTAGASTITADENPYAPRSPTMTSDNTTRLYRIVYFYYDHIAIMDAKPAQYNAWVYNLCQSI